MVLVDKRILLGGIAMLVAGIVIYSALNVGTPVSSGGMTDEEKLDFMIKERENQDFKTLSGILMGVGFLLILISFGARKRTKGGPKKIEKKPAE